MRVSNLDTLSVLLDRVIVENIKRFFFDKDGKADKVRHQDAIIAELRGRVAALLDESLRKQDYEYLPEVRTFHSAEVIHGLERLVLDNLRAGEAERAKLAALESGSPSLEALSLGTVQARVANEYRAQHKNEIDASFKSLLRDSSAKDDPSSKG
jgi:hypothetical protein